MSDSSAVLALPYIQPSQAQKHVTHNEALRLLDVIVQLAVLDRVRVAAPAAPAIGDRYIVAAGATGAWAGQDGRIAVWDVEGWVFFAPAAGWRAEVIVERTSVVFGTTRWVAIGDVPQRFTQLGVNAAPDAVNRLSVSSAATLLNHSGNGHQVKINKAATADTASLLFQTAFSGRAEMGLAGTNDFALKVSADGATFVEALRAAGDGSVALPRGALLPDGTTAVPALRFATDTDTGVSHPAADQIALVTGGQQRALLSNGSLQLDVPVTGTGTQSASHDATAGRLTRLFQTGGVFGLGVVQGQSLGGAVASANTVGISGWYRTDAATTNLPVAATAGLLEVVHGVGGDVVQQRWTAAPGGGALRSWQRQSVGGTWQAWSLIYSQPSFLGSVTQSAGVPTGAAMERGTNANGDYVKIADGTLICTSTGLSTPNASVAAGPLFRSAPVTWTFPMAFAVPPTVCGSVQDGDCWLACDAPTASGVPVRVTAVISKAVNLAIRAVAVGRWF